MISPIARSSESELPRFASGLLSAVDDAWANLSSLAQCSSHRDMCVIAGARMTRDMHRKGATTGSDAFESFKIVYDRFTPSPDTHVDIPSPVGESVSVASIRTPPIKSENFNAQFQSLLSKVQWSPANLSGTAQTTGSAPLSSGRSSSSPGATTVASKRTAPDAARAAQAAKRVKY
jgi:hypothetical protein